MLAIIKLIIYYFRILSCYKNEWPNIKQLTIHFYFNPIMKLLIKNITKWKGENTVDLDTTLEEIDATWDNKSEYLMKLEIVNNLLTI